MSADELSPALLLRLPMPTMGEGGNDEEVEGLLSFFQPRSDECILAMYSMFREVVAL